MARPKTDNTPDHSVLLTPQTPIMVAIEQAILRRHQWSRASVPAAEQIAVRLAGLIAIDLIHAGQRLLENDIGAALQVSRAPVREALRILERERLISFEPRRGAVVTAPNAKDLSDIYIVREALFKILFRQLMERCPADVEATLDRCVPAISRAARQRSAEAFALESFLLNLALFDLAPGRLVADMLASISLRTLRYVRLGLLNHPQRMARSANSWRALQNAVARRDIDDVLRTVEDRIASSRDAALQALEPDGGREPDRPDAVRAARTRGAPASPTA